MNIMSMGSAVPSSVGVTVLHTLRNTIGALRSCSLEDFVMLCEQLSIRRVDKGQEVIKAGTKAEYCIILLSGTASKIQTGSIGNPETVHLMSPGEMMGQEEYFQRHLHDGEHKYTCQVTSGFAILMVCSFAALPELNKRSPFCGLTMMKMMADQYCSAIFAPSGVLYQPTPMSLGRTKVSEILDEHSNHSFFHDMDTREKEVVLEAATLMEVPRCCQVIREGWQTTSVMLLLRGHIEVTNSKQERVSSISKPGEILGDCLLPYLTYKLNVTAVSNVSLLSFSQEKLHELNESHPAAGYKFARNLACATFERMLRLHRPRGHLYDPARLDISGHEKELQSLKLSIGVRMNKLIARAKLVLREDASSDTEPGDEHNLAASFMQLSELQDKMGQNLARYAEHMVPRAELERVKAEVKQANLSSQHMRSALSSAEKKNALIQDEVTRLTEELEHANTKCKDMEQLLEAKNLEIQKLSEKLVSLDKNLVDIIKENRRQSKQIEQGGIFDCNSRPSHILECGESNERSQIRMLQELLRDQMQMNAATEDEMRKQRSDHVFTTRANSLKVERLEREVIQLNRKIEEMDPLQNDSDDDLWTSPEATPMMEDETIPLLQQEIHQRRTTIALSRWKLLLKTMLSKGRVKDILNGWIVSAKNNEQTECEMMHRIRQMEEAISVQLSVEGIEAKLQAAYDDMSNAQTTPSKLKAIVELSAFCCWITVAVFDLEKTSHTLLRWSPAACQLLENAYENMFLRCTLSEEMREIDLDRILYERRNWVQMNLAPLPSYAAVDKHQPTTYQCSSPLPLKENNHPYLRTRWSTDLPRSSSPQHRLVEGRISSPLYSPNSVLSPTAPHRGDTAMPGRSQSSLGFRKKMFDAGALGNSDRADSPSPEPQSIVALPASPSTSKGRNKSSYLNQLAAASELRRSSTGLASAFVRRLEDRRPSTSHMNANSKERCSTPNPSTEHRVICIRGSERRVSRSPMHRPSDFVGNRVHETGPSRMSTTSPPKRGRASMQLEHM